MLVDDDEKLCSQISRFLEKYQFDVAVCHNGNDAPELISAVNPDVVVLDLMLPGADGFEVCRRIRENFKGCILMLTASDDDMDHVAGIEMGADDFLVKPIHPRILLARIKLQLRRLEQVPTALAKDVQKNDNERQFGQLYIHLTKRQVRYQQQIVELTDSEFDLLVMLSEMPDQVHSRDHILKALRGIEYDGLDRSIDVKIAALRKKLGDNPKAPKRFLTLRGKGYMLVQDEW